MVLGYPLEIFLLDLFAANFFHGIVFGYVSDSNVQALGFGMRRLWCDVDMGVYWYGSGLSLSVSCRCLLVSRNWLGNWSIAFAEKAFISRSRPSCRCRLSGQNLLTGCRALIGDHPHRSTDWGRHQRPRTL